MRRVLLVVGLASSANAAPHYTRATRLPTAVPLPDRAKPLVASPTPSAPSLTAADARVATGIALGPGGSIERLAVLQEAIATERDPSILFELAMEYAKHAVAWRAKSDPTSQSQAKDFLIKSVKAMKALVDDDANRTFARLDVALFYYGYVLQQFKYLKEARAVYDKLLKNYPASIYVPSAYLAFADYFYEAGQFADAEARYKMVLKFPKATSYWYAMYRIGWLHVQQQRPQEALETMHQVAKGATDPALTRAARLDFAVVYADIGKADKALAVFRNLDGTAASEMYDQLAATYVARGYFDKAVWTYRDLVAQRPLDPRVCAWQATAARALLALPGATATDRATEIEKVARTAATAKLPDPERVECRENALALTTYARGWHADGSTTNDASLIGTAMRLYRASLEVAPSAETRGLLAEAAWAQAEAQPNARAWATAGAAFVELARDPSTTRPRDAALAGVLAFKNALAIDPDPAVVAGKVVLDRNKRTPKPITLLEKSMLDAFETYASIVRDPEDAELGTMRFIEAAVRRKYDDHQGAVPLLVDFVHWQRDSGAAELAARMLLDSLLGQAKYDEVLEIADRFANDKPFVEGKPALKRDLDFLRSRSLRR